MKFFSTQENLKSGLYTVGNISNKNPNLPILANVLIQAKQGVIKLITTDLEIGITSKIRGKIEKQGEYTVDVKLLSDYISLLPDEKILIELKNDFLKINCGENYKTKIKGQSADNFPIIPEIKRDRFIKLASKDMKNTINQIIFAVAPTNTRPELAGIYLNKQGETLTMASTDSYRLAEKKIRLDLSNNQNEEDLEVIIPAKTMQTLQRIIQDKDKDMEIEKNNQQDEVKIFISENQVLFTYKDNEIISRLIEGKYPDYQQIIPTDFKTVININKNELIRAIKATSLFSQSGTNDINIETKESSKDLIISCLTSKFGESVSKVGAKIKGESNKITFNFHYLLDGLNAINNDELIIKINSENTPGLIQSADKSENYHYIVMPIKQ